MYYSVYFLTSKIRGTLWCVFGRKKKLFSLSHLRFVVENTPYQLQFVQIRLF